jgi:type III secretion protein U
VSDDNSAEKTEPATPKRLREARQRGQVAKSKDMMSVAVLTACVALFLSAGGWYWSNLMDLAAIPFAFIPETSRQNSFPLNSVLLAVSKQFAMLMLPVLIIAALAAAMTGFVQTRGIFSIHPIMPKLENLNPGNGWKRMVSIRSLSEILFSVVKVISLGFAFYMVIKSTIPVVIKIPYQNVSGIRSIGAEIFSSFFMLSLLCMIVVACADVLYQRFQFLKEMRMTKAEIKREFRDMEGDVHVRAQRKAMQRELLSPSQFERAAQATVLVKGSGPTAVALFYDKASKSAPWLIAKGAGAVANKLLGIANENDIPVIIDAALTRDIMASAAIDQDLRSELASRVFAKVASSTHKNDS